VGLVLLPDGRVIFPRGIPELADIAAQLGDESAAEALRQASMTKVLVGKRMCG
jgi:hypothetical protein